MDWVKLGCLGESKLDMTDCFTKHNLLTRYFFPVTVLLLLSLGYGSGSKDNYTKENV